MKWYNAQRDLLPDDGQQVLISLNGVYFICRFDARNRLFKISEEESESFYKVDEYLIYWTHFEDPDF